MATKNDHRVWGDIVLEPIFHDDPPSIKVRLTDKEIFSGRLLEQTSVKFDTKLPEGVYNLSVEFNNKTDRDVIPDLGLDKAVVIKSLTLAGVQSSKFVWSGVYVPNYPEPWYSQQNSRPDERLINQTYLGWNGVWTLTFTSPIFTWIHKIENLGWIYD